MNLRMALMSLLAASALTSLISGCFPKAQEFDRYDLVPSKNVSIANQMTSVGQSTNFSLKSQTGNFGVYIDPVSGRGTIYIEGINPGNKTFLVHCSSAAMGYAGQIIKYDEAHEMEPGGSDVVVCKGANHIADGYSKGTDKERFQRQVRVVFELKPNLALPVFVTLPLINPTEEERNAADEPVSRAARTVEFRIFKFPDNAGGPH